MKTDVTVYFGAHIDDVFLGAFSDLWACKGTKVLVCTTDNLPSPDRYPAAYRHIPYPVHAQILSDEIKQVCTAANITKYIQFDVPDGESIDHIDRLIHQLNEVFLTFDPARIVFPTYEGGHLDHEVLSVILGTYTGFHKKRTEYALYHKTDPQTYVHNRFIAETPSTELSPSVLQHKRKILSLLHSKKTDIDYFTDSTIESLRSYIPPDFSKKPTPYLLYEHSQPISYEKVMSILSDADIL